MHKMMVDYEHGQEMSLKDRYKLCMMAIGSEVYGLN